MNEPEMFRILGRIVSQATEEFSRKVYTIKFIQGVSDQWYQNDTGGRGG
jgi:hypothetical protein